MNVDIGRAVTFAFEDRDWPLKVGILFVLGLIPGLNLIMWGGYALTVARRVMYNSVPLPDWADWADIAVRGLLSIVATLIYFIPALLLVCCLLGVEAFAGSGDITSLALRCCSTLLFILYTLLVNFVLTPGHLRYAQTNQFSVYLDLGARIADLREHSTFFVTLFIYQTILSFIAIFVSLMLSITCLGVPAVLTLAFLANGYILGSVGKSLNPITAHR